LGREWKAAPVTDFFDESSPPAVVGAKGMLVWRGTTRLFAKMGEPGALLSETQAIEAVTEKLNARVVRPSEPSVSPPRVCDCVESNFPGTSMLLLEYAGSGTLESWRLESAASVHKALGALLERLLAFDLIWPGAMPRNVVLEGEQGMSTAMIPVDWELGAYGGDEIGDVHLYRRCIELSEEQRTYADRTLPYWACDWPRLEALLTAEDELRCHLRIDLQRDPRTACMASLLDLPQTIPDSWYARMVLVLSSLTEGAPAYKSLLYSADHVSEWGGDMARIEATVLAWEFQRSAKETAWKKLRSLLTSSGRAIHEAWRSSSAFGSADGLINAEIARLQAAVRELGSAEMGGSKWFELGRKRVREYVAGEVGAVRPRPYQILCQL